MTNNLFELPPLDYEFDALEPFIDARRMEIHHDKHHAGYVKKLNTALENYNDLQKKDIQHLIKNLNNLPENVRIAVRNNGGGHLNHSMFWKLLKKNVKFDAKSEVGKAIIKDFGGYEIFKTKLSETAMSIFGSGWVWLVFNPENKKVEITSTPNQDNPLTKGKIPLLCLDVWEHAYYLKYQNKRDEYIEAFFNVIDWQNVNENYSQAKRGENK